MKDVCVIFSKRNNFATSCEEVQGENFESLFSTDSNRFTVLKKEVPDDLLPELQLKCGNPAYRVVLTTQADEHTGDIGGIPTINVYVLADKLYKKAVS
jgi:hypothetical protein